MGNLTAFAISLGGALATLGAVELLAYLNVLASRDRRKIMHIVTGPIFALTWLNYEDQPSAGPSSLTEGGSSSGIDLIPARVLTASVPALMSVRFAAVGLGLLPDTQLVGSATAIASLCAGDGMAEVVGRWAGHRLGVLPHNPRKTVAGSFACWLAGWGAAVGLLTLFSAQGVLDAPLSMGRIVGGSALCAGVGAVVESLPGLPEGADNALVPLAAGCCALVAL